VNDNNATFNLDKTKKTMLATAIPIALLFLNNSAVAQQDESVEEIVVTGSLIRRTTGFSVASPLTQISAQDISDLGSPNPGDIVRNSVFNFGAATSTTSTIQGTSDQNTRFDLRGLGASATLVMIDGMRVPNSNVNILMPSIGIQRLDILRDGAAQLYGTDAVAGVVNFIPYDSYDGLKMEYHQEQDSRGDFNDNLFSFITGTELGANARIVFAGSYRDQGDLEWSERPSLMRAGGTWSGNGNPGNFIVPLRDENGILTGSTETRPDPNCGVREDPTSWQNNVNGFLRNGRCHYDYGANRSYRNPTQVGSYYTALTWDATPDTTFKAQFNYSRLNSQARGSTSGSSVNYARLPVVRGELPFNPFRAVNASGNALFAQDGNGDGFPDRDANNIVVLDPTGIPFNEDVNFTRTRTFGRSHPLDGTGIHNSDRSMNQEADKRTFRFALTADFKIPFLEEWDGKASYALMQYHDLDSNPRVFSASALIQGMNCDPINDFGACYNPFAPIPGVAESFNNSNVLGAIATNFNEDNRTELQTFEMVANGLIRLGDFELPGGPIGAAFGFQRREEYLKNMPSAGVISGDAYTTNQQSPFSRSREVDAVFAEFRVPILDNLELSAAYREEDFSTGQNPGVMKFGLVYEPTDWLAVRGTWGEAFIAPTLLQLDTPESCGSVNFTDKFTPFEGFTFGCIQGNPGLVPENSETAAFGIDLNLLDDLEIHFNWSKTEFEERIVRTTQFDIVREDFINFQAATGFAPTTANPFPEKEAVVSWMNNPLHDPRILRNPLEPSQIRRINRSDSNASKVLVKSYDIEVDYTLPILRDFGTFGVNLSAIYMDEYLYQVFSDSDVVSAVGLQNNGTGSAAPLPQWKANLALSWVSGSHRALFTTRYTDDVVFDASNRASHASVDFNNWRFTDTVKAWTQADVAYSYSGFEVPNVGGELGITVGARNLFDREAQKTGMIAGVIGEMQDPLGRVIYARVNYEF
jgi:iron complex outermembrane receptor protein